MLGKIFGAALGGKIAKQTNSIGGTTGAMIGAAAPFVLSRMSIPAMIALGIGGYAAKKYFSKSKTDENDQETPAASTKDASAKAPKPTTKKAPRQTKPVTKAPVVTIPQPAAT